MKKIIISKILSILFITSMYGQTEIKIPTNENYFSKFDTGSFNHYNGNEKISITLDVIKIDDENSFPLELIYNTSGIKADEMATEVGLGWRVGTVGQIDKKILGTNSDFLKRFSSVECQVWHNPAGYFSSVVHSNGLDGSAFGIDTPDQFFVNTIFFNTSFIIDRSNRQAVEILEDKPRNQIQLSIGEKPLEERLKFGVWTNNPRTSGLSKSPMIGMLLFHNWNWCTPPEYVTQEDLENVSIINNGLQFSFNEYEYAYDFLSSYSPGSCDGSSQGYDYWSIRDNYVKNLKINCISSILNSNQVNFEYKKYGGMDTENMKQTNFEQFVPETNGGHL